MTTENSQKKPEILFASGMFPPALGGPGTVLIQLIPPLMAMGYQARVLTYGSNNSEDVSRPYPVLRTNLSTPQPFRMIKIFAQTLRWSKNARLLYALDTYTHGLACVCAKIIWHKKMILRFTGDSAWELLFNSGRVRDDIVTFQKKSYGLRGYLLKLRRTIVLKRADHIITDCNFLKQLAHLIGVPEDRITVINNPAPAFFPLESENANDADAASKPPGGIILIISRLVPWKGIRAVIEIMPEVRARFPHAQLCVAGDGPEESSLHELVQTRALGDTVKFLGPISAPAEKIAWYRKADIVVQNTFYEGMSNALMEAMRAGKAIVTTDAGGNPEFAHHDVNALIVRYDNKQEIRDAIIRLLEDRGLRSKLGEHARETAAQYSVEKLAKENVALIRTLLSRP